jgi:uncharacterized membrane protein
VAAVSAAAAPEEDGELNTPRRRRPKAFFDEEEERRIVGAIEAAEHATSGEIRVHLEHRCKGGDAYERGRKVFEELGMTATELRNGVLVYLATGDGVFSVLGDSGIHERVPEGFWDDVVELMTGHFANDDFAGGLVAGIERIGEKLAEFFPYAGDEADVNELPDELSIEDPD